ncbi:MAG TPA: nuclear transport factor 2 family protein, partial [Mycobacteriales bacterium]|nr:nuclear transport factor 2 family protein [Mycobacteriales bacterium]
LSDRDEIAELLARYAIATDRRDFDALRATFTPDGVATYGGVRCEGADAIVEHCRPVADFPVTQHIVGSVSITVDGDTASATSYTTVHVVRPVGTGHEVVHRGLSYDDRLVRTPSGWKFAERFHQVLWSTTEATVWPVPPFGS